VSTRKPLYGWLVAEAISLTGTRISMIALPWLVLTTTGSETKTGLVALAELAPMVLLKVLGGPLIDRIGARRVSIGCDLGSLLVVGSIPLLHALGWLSFPLFLGLVAVAGALRGPGDGAKHALVPVLVDKAGVPMERATGLASTVERGASMLGSALAGGLVAVVGPTNALVVDAGSFGLSAAVLTWSTRSLMSRRPTAVGSGEPVGTPEPAAVTAATVVGPPEPDTAYLTQLREGWDFLRRDPVLLGIAVMVALTNLLDLAYVGLLVPVWAKESGGGAGAIGLLFAVFSDASVIGAMSAAAWGERLPRFRVYLFAFLICGSPRFFILGVDAPLWAVLAIAVAAGFGSGFINPVLGAVVFERIPPHLMGRVTSLSSAMCFALMPFGGLLGGVLVGQFGLAAALFLCGAAYLVVTMMPAFDPRWRDMDRRPVVSSPDSASDPSFAHG